MLDFNDLATDWWDTQGPVKTLHALNPVRLKFICKNTQIKNKKILDLGCGAGILSESLAELEANVTGIDISEDLITTAKEHLLLNKNSLNINYQKSNIDEFIIKNPDLKFDIITCMELLEHISDPQQLINNCQKILSPKGHLFLSTLNRTVKSYLLAIAAAEYIFNILPKNTHDYKKFIRPSELELWLRNAKLKLENISGIDYNPFNNTAKLNTNVQVNYIIYAQNL